MYIIYSNTFCLQISEAVPSISQVMNSICESGGTLLVVQDTKDGLIPRVWFNRHSAVIGGGMSTIHTVVRSPRTFIRASSPAADASRVKHSISSMSRSVKMVTFAQARLELAAKTSSGLTEKSTPATNAKSIITTTKYC